jgi:hypothetical protein
MPRLTWPIGSLAPGPVATDVRECQEMSRPFRPLAGALKLAGGVALDRRGYSRACRDARRSIHAGTQVALSADGAAAPTRREGP